MPKFKGGISIDSKGYLTIKAGPLRDKRVHVLVAEAMLGRALKEDEDVDHKDGNKLNPHPSNLIVRSKATHGHLSNKRRWRGYVENILTQRAQAEDRAWQEFLKSKDEINDTDFGFGSNTFESAGQAQPLGIRGTGNRSKDAGSQSPVQRNHDRNVPVSIDRIRKQRRTGRSSGSNRQAKKAVQVAGARKQR